MPLRIIGKVAPVNIQNAHLETFLPGCFDEFLHTPEAKNLPMRFMHEHQVGIWSDLHLANDWLYNIGVLDDREAEYAVRHGKISEQSIGYRNMDVDEALKDAKLKGQNQWAAIRGSRLDRMINAAAKAVSKMSKEKAFIVMNMAATASSNDKLDELLEVLGKKYLEPEVVKRVALDEISLVDNGSFKGCTFHWEAI